MKGRIFEPHGMEPAWPTDRIENNWKTHRKMSQTTCSPLDFTGRILEKIPHSRQDDQKNRQSPAPYPPQSPPRDAKESENLF